MSDEIVEETRYFFSLRSFKHYKIMREKFVEEGIMENANQAVYVTLSYKHRKLVLKTIKLPVPMSHLIGQWRKTELKKLSEGSSEEYDEELVSKEQAWFDNLMERYNFYNKFKYKRRSPL